MDKFLSNFSGGVPLQLDDFRWFLSQSGNKGIYAYFDELQRDFGNDLILQGCVVSGANPNKSLTEGWILLGGEVLKVDAIAGTLDTSTDSHYTKVTTFDSSGDKLLRNQQTVQTYEKARGVLSGTFGNLKFDVIPMHELGRITKIDESSVITHVNIHKRVISTGDWNMSSTTNIAVNHGLTTTQSENILSVDVIIQQDTSSFSRPLNSVEDATSVLQGGVGVITPTQIALWRITGGVFDSANFDDTSFNRGFVTVTYIV